MGGYEVSGGRRKWPDPRVCTRLNTMKQELGAETILGVVGNSQRLKRSKNRTKRAEGTIRSLQHLADTEFE